MKQSWFSLIVLSIFISACGSSSSSNPNTRPQFLNDNNLKDSVSVIDHYPADNTKNIPLDTPIVVQFSGQIDPSSVDHFRVRLENESGRAISGEIVTNSAGTEIKFYPRYNGERQPLQRSTTYYFFVQFLKARTNGLLIAPYVFKFKTLDDPISDGSFRIVRFYPTGDTIKPTQRFSVEFSQEVQRTNNGTGARCSRTYWADAFQLVSIPILTSGSQGQAITVSGEVCIDSQNAKIMHFNPDRNLGVDGNGRLFDDGSIADLEVRKTDSLRSANTEQGLLKGEHARKWVVPGIAYLITWFFGDQ